MALTLNNFTGFETQGDDEASAVTGTLSYETTNQRSGESALIINTPTEDFRLPWAAGNVTDAGGSYIFGVAFRYSGSGAAPSVVIEAEDDAGSRLLQVFLKSSGALALDNAASTEIDSTAVLDVDRWYFVEVFAELNTDPGSWEWFLDGVSLGSGTTDLTSGNSFGSAASSVQLGPVTTGLTLLVDDVYILSGATSASDRYGDFAAKAYQNTAEDATDQGDTLADGTWALVSETPGNSGTSNDAQYQDTGNLTGSTIMDEGTRAGPSGDSDVTGATIKGAKFISNLMRGTGGGRTHTILHGNDTDGVTATADLGLTTSYIIYEVLSESASIVPTTSENFQMGFSKSATAGQDILCGDQWAMLGYVPSAVGPETKTKTLSADSLLQKQDILKTASADALLAKLGLTETLSADALLVKTALLTLSADSLLQKNVSLTTLADALLQKLGIEKTVSADALLVQTIEKTLSADAVLQKLGTEITMSADALLQKANITVTALVDALLQKTITQTLSADARLLDDWAFHHVDNQDAAYLSKTGGFDNVTITRTGMLAFRIFMPTGEDGGAVENIFTNSTNIFDFRRTGTNKFQFFFTNTAQTSQDLIETDNAFVAADGWLSILLAWNTNAGSGSRTFQLYINDAAEPITVSPDGGAYDPAFDDSGTWGVFHNANSPGTGIPDICSGDIYVNNEETLDFSTESNRRLFFDANNNQVDKGADGSTPTGNQPLVFVSDDAADWGLNKGKGGGFTITNTFIACAVDQRFTLSADALLQKMVELTTSADAVLLKNVLVTLSADALLQKTETKTLSADALLQLLDITKTTSADALLQKVGITKTTSADALLQKTQTLTLSADALLQALGITKTTSADALLQKLAITKTVSADALLQKLVELTFVADALLQKQGITLTASADAILSQIGAKTLTASADALLQVLVSLTASADALLQLQGIENTISADSLLQKSLTLTVSADAILRARQVLQFSTDALLLKQGVTLTTSANAVLRSAIAAAVARHRGFTQNVGKMMG